MLPGGENQFPNRDCQWGALRCENVISMTDAVTSGLVSVSFEAFVATGKSYTTNHTPLCF